MERLTRGERLRRYVAFCRLENARAAGLEEITRGLRARLVADHPAASVSEIEQEVAAIIAAGMQPTKSVVAPASPGIPKDIVEARRAARRKVVSAGRPGGRGDDHHKAPEDHDRWRAVPATGRGGEVGVLFLAAEAAAREADRRIAQAITARRHARAASYT